MISKRQQAFKDGDHQQYKAARNKVNRLNKQLKGNYYKLKVEELKDSNCRKWWKSVTQLTGNGPSGGNELESLANQLTNGDPVKLANDINQFFQSVSRDLPKPDPDIRPPRIKDEAIPDAYIIPVLEMEKQLMRLDVAKAPGPDNIPTWC